MKAPARVPLHEGRSLLRHLLREATYLPDSAAQAYIKKLVVLRFRARSEKGGDAEKWLLKARRNLSILQRANMGEEHPLLKVLHLTYGRTGPRRRQLLRPLLQPDTEPDHTPTLEKEMERVRAVDPASWDLTTIPVPPIFQTPPARKKKQKADHIEYKLSDDFSKLKAVVQSQRQTNPPTTRQQLKADTYLMPATNIWSRPMPRCRAKNLVGDWRAAFLDRLLPPLPEQEWLRLQALVQGTMEWGGCKPRRKRPAGKPDIINTIDLEKFVHVEVAEPVYLDVNIKLQDTYGPVERETKINLLAGDSSVRSYWGPTDRWLAEPKSVAEAEEQMLLDELHLVRPLNKKSSPNRGHTITSRFMKRLWTKVFRMCPLLTPLEPGDNKGRKWQVIWGSVPNLPPTASAFAPLFQGVPVGSSSKKKSTRRPKSDKDDEDPEMKLRT
jgi:hypothetical protein